LSFDLLFRLPPASTPDLLFGEVEGLPDATAYAAGVLPGFRGSIEVGYRFPITLAGVLPGFTGAVQARYVSDTDRPLVSKVGASHQDAAALQVGSQNRYERAEATEVGPQTGWGASAGLRTDLTARHQDAVRTSRANLAARHQDADHMSPTGAVARHQDALRDRRLQRTGRYQEAVGARAIRSTDWQERHRDRRPAMVVPWGAALRLPIRRSDTYGQAAALDGAWLARHQDAMRPPAGTSVPPIVVPPPFNPCYLPDPDLVFSELAVSTGSLLLICQPGGPTPPGQIVVPIRRVYMTVNSATLTRVVGGIEIPVLGMDMSLDVDSWTWSFSASVPGRALPNLQPVGGDPVELEAVINGVSYRFYAESLAWERVFGRTSIRLGGRGKAASLDAPYAPVLTFGNSTARTAEQLVNDILTFNGVPLGWTVDFDLDDWTVPGGVWSHQGTYISALNAVAAATGAYVQPHNTDQALSLLLRYPVPAWEWDGVTADYVLPADVVSREGIAWTNKPEYNRVYVSGQKDGVLGRYTRTGTAGDLVAPSVVDPLITAAVPVRQRGRAILSDTGRVAMVSLRMPVLSSTGIIRPGKFVEYDDGGTVRIGLTRAVSVNVSMPTIYQTLEVETHV
jgi:hypothetical protein